MARRPSPSLRALLFWCGEGAVSEAFGEWKTAQTASFLVGSESNVRQWGPWPTGPVRPSGPCCFGVAKAPFLKLLATTLGSGARGPQAQSVLQGPAVLVWRRRRLWSFWRLEDSPVRPSGPCCFGVAKAPFVRLLATGRQLRQLVFL